MKRGENLEAYERLKILRNDLGLSLDKFGSFLGVKRSGLSLIENGKNNLTDQMVISICNTNWNGKRVNPEWLRHGKEPMYIEPDTFSLDELLSQRMVDRLEVDIIRLYFGLEPDFRRQLLQHFKDGLSASQTAASASDIVWEDIPDPGDFITSGKKEAG